MSELIEKQAAIDAIEEVDWYHQNKNKDMVSGANSSEHQAWYKADDVYKTLESLPSTNAIPIEWIEKRIKDLMQKPTETDEPWFPITHAEIVILEDLIDDWEKENE